MTGEGKLIPDLDPCYEALGDNVEERRTMYQDYIKTTIPGGEWEFIREVVNRGQLTGNARYIEEVKRIIGRRIEHRRPGRPKNADNAQK